MLSAGGRRPCTWSALHDHLRSPGLRSLRRSVEAEAAREHGLPPQSRRLETCRHALAGVRCICAAGTVTPAWMSVRVVAEAVAAMVAGVCEGSKGCCCVKGFEPSSGPIRKLAFDAANMRCTCRWQLTQTLGWQAPLSLFLLGCCRVLRRTLAGISH